MKRNRGFLRGLFAAALFVTPTVGCAIESVQIGGDVQSPTTGFTTTKLDILFVVDNSARMEMKQNELAFAARRMLEVLEPQCIEGGVVLGKVPPDGRCPRGTRQFSPLDIHVGLLTSSIGGLGSETCAPDPAFHNDDLRELVHRTLPKDSLTLLSVDGFLAGPGGPDLAADTEKLIRGVGQDGCGLEAPLEALYQFLNAPDPYGRIEIDAGGAHYAAVSSSILSQRSAFLRPDSAVLIVILSDEDDASVNPLSIAGSGWAFLANDFPTSTRVPSAVAHSPSRRRQDKGFLGGTGRGTTACLTDVTSRECTSCAFRFGCDEILDAETCASIAGDPRCLDNNGYCRQEEDNLNIRFHLMKSRYGVEPRFPIARYARGLSSEKLPDRDHAVTAAGEYVEPTAETPLCTNPLFAAQVPRGDVGQDLCALSRGPRPLDAVQIVVLAGVPAALLPSNGEPTAVQYRRILGEDPERERLDGIDPHMRPSVLPREGLTKDPANPDPIHFRDWDNGFLDLQLACAWELAEPISTSAAPYFTDDCAGPSNSPLCGKNTIVGGGAVPGLRHTSLAKALGTRATLGSICGATRKATELGDRDYVRSLRAAEAKLWRFVRQ